MAGAGILAPDERVELLDGHVVLMSPSGSRHSYLVTTLARALIRHAPETLSVRVQEPLNLSKHSQPEPDLAVVHSGPGRHWSTHPDASDAVLVVEVAETSLEQDLAVKVPLYLAAGIPEVWVVDVVSRSARVWFGGSERRPDSLTSAALPGLHLAVASLFPE